MFEFTGDTLTYKLKSTTYTATTSPTIVNLSDLGYDANTHFMFHNLFTNQTNLTKVLHFPKITGTNLTGNALFRSCNNVEYIDLSNIGNLNSLYLLFNGCTSLKNLNLDNVDLSNYTYANTNTAFYNVPNDIQISMDGCNCESIVTIKQALNDNGFVTYNNNVVTNKNCTIEPYETIEYNVFFDIDENETYNKELKADSIYMIVYNYNEDGVYTLTESDIREEVSYEYEQFEEDGEDKIRCTIYYNGNNIYEITYKGNLSNTDTSPCALSCDTDKTIPMQKFYINWYDGIDWPGYHFIGFSTLPDEYGDCNDCDWGSNGIYICPSENIYQKPNGDKGSISDLPMEGSYYVLDMGETVYFKCGERNALFDHVFYCKPSIVTENTLSFKYDGRMNSNVRINGSLYQITASDGELLDDNYYKYTTTLSEPLTDLVFNSGNIFELYAIPQTTNVTSMNMMFYNCLCTNLNLSGLDTSNVTNMSGMYYNCSSLQELNVTGWDISKVTSYSNMFQNCTSLNKLILGDEVSQSTYDWWYERLKNARIQDNVTITSI